MSGITATQVGQTAKKDMYAILALLLMSVFLVGALVSPVAFAADGHSGDDDSGDDDSGDELRVTCLKDFVFDERGPNYSYVHPITGEAISPSFNAAPDTGFGFPPGTILAFPSGSTCTSPGLFLLPG